MNCVARALYYALVVCVCFEEVFSRMWLPFKYFKYLLVPALVILIFVKLNGKIKFPLTEKFAWLFVCVTVFSAIVSVGAFMEIDWDGFVVIKKYAFVPFLVLCFYYSTLFNLKAEKLIVFFAECMVFFAVSSVFLYFVRIPVWNELQRFYWGRITVGYPTIDAVNCAVAIGVFVFCGCLKIPFWIRTVGTVCLIVSIVLQTSGTGLGLLVGLIVVAVFAVLFKFKMNYEQAGIICKIGSIVGVVLVVSASSIYGFLKQYDAALLENMSKQIQNRAAIMLNQDDSELNLNTMDSRTNEFERASVLYLKDPVRKFFGVGFGIVSYEPKKFFSGFRIFLESQWHLVLFTTGYLGALLMLFMFAEMLKVMLKDKNCRLCTIYGVFCIFISLFTSCTFMSFALTGPFALLYAEYKQKRIEVKERL